VSQEKTRPKINQTQHAIGNRPDDGAWIHSALDDFGLSVAEFRVYCHILRRAGTNTGHYWEGAKNAAKHCRINRTTYDKALINLERYQMIQIERRKGETSLISPLAKQQWLKPPLKKDVPSTQNGYTQKRTHPTPKEDVPSPQNEEPQNRPTPKEDEVPTLKEDDPPTPKEDDEVYPYEVNPTEGYPNKEEREIRDRNPRTVENSPSWDEPEPIKTKTETTPFKTQISVDIDQCSAPPSPSQKFDFEAFDWASYSKPRSGGSDPEYFAWAIAQVMQYNDEKVSQGKPSIGDIQSYTRSTIQNRGAEGYLKYLQSKGLAPNTLKPPTPLPTPPKDLNWQTPKSSELAIYSDLSEQLATIQAHLKLNQWSWSTPRLQLWVAMAQDNAQRWKWPTIDFQPNLGCSNWPDWAIAKLAQDLEASSHA
jgi:hypothetical protein